MELAATIEMPNGLVNGYQGVPGSDSILAPDVHSLLQIPALPQPPHVPDFRASESVASAAPQSRSTTDSNSPAGIKKPAEKKAAGRSRQAGTAAASKPAGKPQRHQSGIKYLSQAGMDRDLARLEALSRAAQAGDTAALDKLRADLDLVPHIWRRLADLEQLVELKLITLVAGNSPLQREAFRKRCAELRHHLLDDEPGSLATKMAASRVVMTWLFLQFLEIRALESPAMLHSIKQLEQAERRYQVAMRTYVMARQLDVQLQRLAM